MNNANFSEKIELLFQKSEYITLSHLNVKMYTCPKLNTFEKGEVFCFTVSEPYSDALLKRLCDYTKSIVFYSGKSSSEILVLPIFLGESEAAIVAKKVSKVVAIPFCLSKNGSLLKPKKSLFINQKLIDNASKLLKA